ncbi:MAG: Gfo/Idh/MocA family protein [Limisphaerales bacterium]
MKNPSHCPGITRRRFLATAGVAIVAPTIIPASVFGAEGRPAPSERITLASVGWGMQGPGNTDQFLAAPNCQVVAACDLDQHHLGQAVNKINTYYSNQDCKAYHDYREMMARDDIDAVMLAVPDHWHALVATEACRRKKDVYGEKPLARTVHEQQAIVKAVHQNKRVWQMGSWQRSVPNFHKGAEIVRNGLIGKVTHVEVGLPSGHYDFAHTAPALLAKLEKVEGIEKPISLAKIVPGGPGWDVAVTEPPTGFDYQTWIGPSTMEPYIEAHVHMNWRWNYNTGGGQLLDWIGHHCDIAHWGLDFDNTGPSEIEGHGEFPPSHAIWNTSTKYRIELKYPKDITMTIAGGHSDIRSGTKWIGTDGWVWVDRGGFEASNAEWKKRGPLPEELRKVKLYESANHWRNFLECVKSRKPTIAPVDAGHHSALPGQLGLISMLVGRKIKWDAKKEVILGDAEASKLLSRPYREPYKLV